MAKKTSGLKVKQVMTTVPITCTLDMTLDKVVELITLAEINAVLVVDKKGAAKGIISLMDLLKEYDTNLKSKKAQDIMHPRPDMKEKLYVISGGKDIADAAKEMYENRIHRLVVLDPKKKTHAAGVVSASDIVHAMMRSEEFFKE